MWTETIDHNNKTYQPDANTAAIFTKIDVTKNANNFTVTVYGNDNAQLEELVIQGTVFTRGTMIQPKKHDGFVTMTANAVQAIQLVAAAGRMDNTIDISQIAMPMYHAGNSTNSVTSTPHATAIVFSL